MRKLQFSSFLPAAIVVLATLSIAVIIQYQSKSVTAAGGQSVPSVSFRSTWSNPYIKLSDARDLPASDERDASGELRPLALASADFDEDGLPDLISAHADSG